VSFSLNWTPAILTILDPEAETVVAETVVIPETVAPADGALMDTNGGTIADTAGDVVSMHVKLPVVEGPGPLDGFAA
jgi:hypothetical protein